MIPQNMLLLAFRPRVLFPINGCASLYTRLPPTAATDRAPSTVIWGMLTAVSAAATKVEHLYAIKFFQVRSLVSELERSAPITHPQVKSGHGRSFHLCWRREYAFACRSARFITRRLLAEPSDHGTQHYILGAWYKPHEIGRRAAIFSIAGQAATLFSGPMQSEIPAGPFLARPRSALILLFFPAALYHNLNGKHGIAGWQWLFIVCGLISERLNGRSPPDPAADPIRAPLTQPFRSPSPASSYYRTHLPRLVLSHSQRKNGRMRRPALAHATALQ